eukprot:s6017_g2.t1
MLLRVQPQAFSPKPAKPCLWCPNIVLLWLLGVLQQPCDVRSRLSGDWPVPPECASALRVIPKYAQLLRLEACQVNKGSRSDPAREIEVIQPLEVEVIQPLEVEVIQPLVVHRLPSEPSCWYEAAWGIPFSPSEFLECAVAAGHPAMLEGHLPKELQDQQKCIFNPSDRRASLSEEQLRSQAHDIQKEVLSKVTSQGREIDEILKRKTLDELEKGWLVGPIKAEDLPIHAIISKRLGLRQAQGKTRLIDDFSISHVNESVGAEESPKPHTADVLCATALQTMKAFPGKSFVGRAYDLQAAYKQVPIRPSSSWAAYVAHYDCDTMKPSVEPCPSGPPDLSSVSCAFRMPSGG